MRYEFIEQRKIQFITPTTLLLLIFADKNRNNNISIDCSHIDSNIHRIFLFLFLSLSLSLSPSLSFSLSKHVSYPATGVWAFKGAGVAFFFFSSAVQNRYSNRQR